MKQVEVHIMGQSYLLVAPEGVEDKLQQSAAKVDTAMCRIRDAGKVKARDRIAVLAALNLAFEAEAQAPAVTKTSSEAGPDAHETDARLATLLGKLDQVLMSDSGQLL